MFYYLKRGVWYLFHKPKCFLDYIWCKFAPFIPDRTFIKVRFRLCVGYKLNLDHPKTYNEKLQWLKFNDLHDEYSQLVDKFEAKKYVSSLIGEDYIIPTLETWDSVDEIKWDTLPQQFVIKSTSDSGGVVVCEDKSAFDTSAAYVKLKKLGNRDYSMISKEYPYKNVRHRIIAEKYMVDESGYELKDYKFFCFNGVVRFFFVATGRMKNDIRFDFFDLNFVHLPVINGHPNAENRPNKPQNFEKMVEIASKLSQGIPQVRVDLYNISGKVYFGEFTFFHYSGLEPFMPKRWDYIFGEMLSLPM